MKLSEIDNVYENIVKSNEPQHVKNNKLSHLMTLMEKHYSIPSVRNEGWEIKNRKVISLYRKIARSRTI